MTTKIKMTEAHVSKRKVIQLYSWGILRLYFVVIILAISVNLAWVLIFEEFSLRAAMSFFAQSDFLPTIGIAAIVFFALWGATIMYIAFTYGRESGSGRI